MALIILCDHTQHPEWLIPRIVARNQKREGGGGGASAIARPDAGHQDPWRHRPPGVGREEEGSGAAGVGNDVGPEYWARI